MLATRVATAAVLVPLVVAGIIFLPTRVVTLIFAVLMAVGAWEWSRLLGWDKVGPRIGYLLVYVGLAAVFCGSEIVASNPGIASQWLLALACVWWLAVVYWLVRYPKGWAESIGKRPVGGVVGLLVLCAAVTAVAAIHGVDKGVWLLLLFFVLIWGVDTGAYFAGRTLGYHNLAPNISPGKTLEGAVGGVIAALIVAVAGGCLLGYGGTRLAGFVLLGGWIAVVSIFGDLTLSMFKRHAGIKDSGSLFPGHGGVLDRLDSQLAAAPWFAIGLVWLQ